MRDKFGKFVKGNHVKTEFKNGLVPWNKGLTKESSEKVKKTGEKIRIALKGRTLEEMWGKEKAEEFSKNMSKRLKGKKRPKFSESWLKNMSISMMGHKSAKKGKTFEEIYGEEKGKKLKEGRVINQKERWKNPEYKDVQIEKLKSRVVYWGDKISKSTKGEKNYFYGKHHTKESKEKMKEARAKQISPKKDTTIEIKIQDFLKELKIDFLTHQYLKDIEHGYQCDILIPSLNMVIECDGDYWHKYPIGRDIDHIRTSELLQKGFKVLRLWEFEIRKMDLNEFSNKLNIREDKNGSI